MTKKKSKAESIYNLNSFLDPQNPLPIYFFFGEDSYTISKAVDSVLEIAEKFLASDFDKQIIETNKETHISEIIDEASSFPFGGEKKIVVVKNFENVNDKKNFAGYVNDPSDFTVLVVTQTGKKLDLVREPFSSLAGHNYLFEAHELKGMELNQWIVREAKALGLTVSLENALSMVDIIGQNKSLIKMNLHKFSNYLSDDKEITPELIINLTSKTKEYTVFNLQDAIGSGNKSKALKIAYNLLSHGIEPIFMISMLSKFIITIARSIELSAKNIPENIAAKEIEVSYYYYKNCRRAKYLMSFENLSRASDSLLWADQTLKTTSIDSKSLISVLISRILG